MLHYTNGLMVAETFFSLVLAAIFLEAMYQHKQHHQQPCSPLRSDISNPDHQGRKK